MLTVNTGVPQGSILGLQHFIIYINDISKASNLFKFIIYADDTTVSATMEIVISEFNNYDIEAMINKELVFINDWLKSNKLSLYINKYKYMIFHIPQKKVKPVQLHIETQMLIESMDSTFLVLL